VNVPGNTSEGYGQGGSRRADEINLREWLCEMVSNIDGSVDLFKMGEIALDPFTKGKILNVNMARAHRGL
jgi:hypothetical protein